MCRITDNIGLVYNEAKKINLTDKLKRVYDKEDIVSIGILGLINANKTFDSSKGFKFSTYATYCIRHEMYVAINKENKEIYADSIDEETGETKNTIINMIYDKRDNIHIDDRTFIKDIIYKLDEESKYCICSFYGLYNYRKLTQKRIGMNINRSQKYVSAKIKKTVRYIQKQLNVGGEE